jgi:hypothetical protein
MCPRGHRVEVGGSDSEIGPFGSVVTPHDFAPHARARLYWIDKAGWFSQPCRRRREEL